MIFYSYQSIGNEFILFDVRKKNTFESYFGVTIDQLRAGKFDVPVVWAKKVRELCDRKGEYGADGVLVVCQFHGMTSVLVYNADGSYGSFCGNGARIVGSHISNGVKGRSSFFVGEVPVAVIVESASNATVQVAQPMIEPVSFPNAMGWQSFYVDVGNPHLIFLQKISHSEFSGIAPVLARGNSAIGDVNLSFAWPVGHADYQMLVFERGVGETKSCGSAALALFHLLRFQKNADRLLRVVMPGGAMLLSVGDDCSINLSATVSLKSSHTCPNTTGRGHSRG